MGTQSDGGGVGNAEPLDVVRKLLEGEALGPFRIF